MRKLLLNDFNSLLHIYYFTISSRLCTMVSVYVPRVIYYITATVMKLTGCWYVVVTIS